MRAPLLEEILGSDYCVHNILHEGIGVEEAVDILSAYHEDIATGLDPAGVNLGHVIYLEMHFNNRDKTGREAWSAAVRRSLTNLAGMDDSDEEAAANIGEDEIKAFGKRIRTARRPRKSEGGGAFGGRGKVSN